VRGTVKSGTEVTRLVTGDPAQINAVVAGIGPTTILAVTPVNPPTELPAYPAGVIINGQELTIDRNITDGLRAWFNVQISDWDPNGDGPNLAAYQVKVDCAGYYHSDCLDLNSDTGNDGLDLVPAVVACPGDDPTPCMDAFGESWAPCNGLGNGMCDPGYLDLGANRPDSWCTPGGGGCNTGGVAIGTCNYSYFAVSNAVPGHRDQPGTCAGGTRPGQGCNTATQCPGGACTGPKLDTYYGGTLVLDLPAGAKGKYTIALNADETFVVSPGSPPVRIETLQENGFVVNYVTALCADSDADGVCDADDVCPSTPPCVAVDAQGRPLGGLDSDCDVDLDDFHEFSACLGGPGRLPAGGCAADADLDGDGDVDLHDFQLFQQGFIGPIQP